MLRNYFTTAWRNFARHKTFSTINLLGLTIGMTACLLILQYVRMEKSYDQFHETRSDLYRVVQDRFDKGVLSTRWASGCAAVGNAMKEDFPEVKANTTVRHISGTMSFGDVHFREESMYLVMPAFFEMFSYPVVSGNPSKDFEEPFKAMVSESTARKYFGDENPVGKTVRLNKNNEFAIVGVFEDVPANSHMKFDWLFSYQTFVGWVGEGALNAWQWDGFYTYVLLNPGSDAKALEAKLPVMVEERAGEELKEYDAGMEFHLQPVADIHLTSDLMYEMEANGNGQYVQFLLIIAVFILFIAWVNYINLSTAKSAERAREVGIRKVMGSYKSQLIRQFLAEALMTNIVAAILAVGLSYVMVPYFNSLTGQTMTLVMFEQPSFWLIFLSVLIGGSLLSGFYPAFVLASFQPVTVLKGSFSSSGKGVLLRKLLVGFQFAISLLLIAGTLTVYQQLNYMRSQDLGVDIDQTLVLKAPNISDSTYADKLRAFKTELARPQSITHVTSSTSVPGRQASWNAGGVRLVGAPASASSQYRIIGVDYDFVDAYQLALKEGRTFDESFGTDEATVLFNESAIKRMGFQSNEEAIGNDIFFWGDTFKIVGVLADYHHQSLKVAPDPLIFRLIPSSQNYYSVKISTAGTGETLQDNISHIESVWGQFFAGSPMDYFFLDTYFDEQYKNDRNFGKAFAGFALLAIIVACMGLFGLSAYSAIQRTKEVGIRKVLGASEFEIVRLLTREIIILISIAGLISLPIAWVAMRSWLMDYAYRIDLGWSMLVLPLLGLLFITLLTVSVQTFRTARTNPVKALRYE